MTETLVQCDFDGTITVGDVSHLLLDVFADGDWRAVWKDYVEGRIPVGTCNKRVFALVKASREEMTDYVINSDRVVIRPGFRELLDCCSRRGFEFVIVSNGLLFYIEAILERLSVRDIKVYAAENRFRPGGVAVRYVGPDGAELEEGFKEAYTEHFLRDGYRVVYVGNGASDIYPARRAKIAFATEDLLERCRQEKLGCRPFNDLNDVVRGLDGLSV
jgi:2-hydroxy-3-keto-5-methylthiopentenyl-1-phosphate phosphatase